MRTLEWDGGAVNDQGLNKSVCACVCACLRVFVCAFACVSVWADAQHGNLIRTGDRYCQGING